MSKTIDFYLTTAEEYGLLSLPRACRQLGRFADVNRDDYMLVEIDPPLIGQSFGLGDKDITRLLLSTRHQGHSLFPIDEWPAHVYVTRLLDQKVISNNRFSAQQVELIAWGLLFRNYSEAEAHAKKFRTELL